MGFRDMLRPVVRDAAQSLDAGGYVLADDVMGWFEAASEEALQECVMYGVQRGILFALDIAPIPDMDGVQTIEEREAFR